MSITLYHHPFSPPSRAVRTLLLISKAKFEEKVIDLTTGENTKPEYTKINPNQTVPSIVQGDFKLFESHAIMKYIRATHKDTCSQPPDFKIAAKIDAYLDWHHMGMRVLGSFVFDFYFGPNMMKLPEPANKLERLAEVDATIQFFEKVFLEEGKVKLIGNSPTPSIAELAVACETASLFAVNFDFSKFPVFSEYIARLFAHPDVQKSHKEFFEMLKGQKQVKYSEFIQNILVPSKAQQQLKQNEQILFYSNPVSPYSRSVMALLLLSKIEYTDKRIDLMKQEHLTPEFTSLNPNQTVPFIKQGAFKLFESHAILKYLAEQYNLQYYPKDNLHLKAKLDSYLDWHHSGAKVITDYVMDFYFKPLLFKAPEAENKPGRTEDLEWAIKFFTETFLEGGKFIYIYNNDNLSIADLSAISSLSVLLAMNYDFKNHPVLQKYIVTMFAVPQIKAAHKELFQMIMQQKVEYNPFVKEIVFTKKKAGCC